MSVNGITAGTPSKIPFGAGVYFSGITYDEKVVPNKAEILAHVVGATQEGGTLTITPEFFAPELDGANVALAELKKKVGETAQMEVSFAEFSTELVANMVMGKVTDSTDGKFDVVTSNEFIAGHFYEGFGYYGELLDGRPVIIVFKKALCTSGFTMEPKNKSNSVLKGTFECHSDIAYGADKLPYAIFVYKHDKWVQDGGNEWNA